VARQIASADYLDNTTAADAVGPTVAVGAAFAGASNTVPWPQATSFLGSGLRSVISKIGRAGALAGQGAKEAQKTACMHRMPIDVWEIDKVAAMKP